MFIGKLEKGKNVVLTPFDSAGQNVITISPLPLLVIDLYFVDFERVQNVLDDFIYFVLGG